ncbi:MAG: cell division protein FtsZ [Magnetococcales bacterium]|nr:cell division protein FtsZ [Magnetococcales bacterium]
MSDLTFDMPMGEPGAVIKVIGVGGGGGNAINNMITSNLENVAFIAANTDAQVLTRNLAATRIQLGEAVTRGLGAGAKPDVGRDAAEESQERLREVMNGADMVFITAGMGGGTGTGAAPVIARLAKDQGILTVAVVTKPFQFEGKKRMQFAEDGLEELRKHVDTVITIPNQKLLSVVGKNTPFREAFRRADDVLHQAVRGITDLINKWGFINVDFADVRTVMGEMGQAVMGSAEASGENRALDAATAAISSPLLDDVSIHGARGVLINITSGEDLTLQEVDEAASVVKNMAHEDAIIIYGHTLDPAMENRVSVTVVATGIGYQQAVIKDELLNRERAKQAMPAVGTARQPQPMVAVGGGGPAMMQSTSSKGSSSTTGTASPAISTATRYLRKSTQSGAEVQLDDINNDSSGAFSVPTFLRRQND